MRTKKPRRASMDEVKISRDGDSAIIEVADQTISTTHLKIGPHVDQISDPAILAMFNDLIAGMKQLAAQSGPPLGRKSPDRRGPLVSGPSFVIGWRP